MSSTTRPVIDTYPAEITIDRVRLGIGIEALLACEQACRDLVETMR